MTFFCFNWTKFFIVPHLLKLSSLLFRMTLRWPQTSFLIADWTDVSLLNTFFDFLTHHIKKVNEDMKWAVFVIVSWWVDRFYKYSEIPHRNYLLRFSEYLLIILFHISGGLFFCIAIFSFKIVMYFFFKKWLIILKMPQGRRSLLIKSRTEDIWR